jgi:hypothetical protein
MVIWSPLVLNSSYLPACGLLPSCRDYAPAFYPVIRAADELQPRCGSGSNLYSGYSRPLVVGIEQEIGHRTAGRLGPHRRRVNSEVE